MAKDGSTLLAGDEGGALPPELAEVAAALDRLAQHEAACAGAGLEGRVFVASRAALADGIAAEVAEVAAAADALAAAERATAGPALEDRLFMATRRLVVERAPAEPAVVVRARGGAAWMRWAKPALAAAAALAVGIGWWVSSRPSGRGESRVAAIGGDATAGSAETLATHEFVYDGMSLAVADDLGLSEHFPELSSEVDALSQRLRGDWFELGLLVHEEAM